jgi:hypothetical protein
MALSSWAVENDSDSVYRFNILTQESWKRVYSDRLDICLLGACKLERARAKGSAVSRVLKRDGASQRSFLLGFTQ